MSPRLPAAEVALVGLGAANGVVAHVLTEAGLEVAALEAGPRVDRSAYAQDEIRNDIRGWLSRHKALHEVPTWRTHTDGTAGLAPWPMLMVNGVGGTSLHYEGLSIRLHPWNFQSRSRVLERYGAGAIPDGSTLADWPLTYDELEPYYERVEQAIGVAGVAANVIDVKPNPLGNAFEGERASGYVMGPLRPTGWSELMAGAARRLGWHPFPAPAAINSEPFAGRPACTYCGFCQYNPCYCDAKGSVNLNVIRAAEDTGLLRIETGARVVSIDTDAAGMVCGVTFIRDGEVWRQPAKVVVIGTFVFEHTRLLLVPRSRAHPEGLANGNREVGRHYMAHAVPFVYGLFPGRRLKLFSGNGSQVTCLDDFNADHFSHSGLDFVGGGMLTAIQELAPIAFARTATPPSIPRWGAQWKAWLAANAQSVGPTYAQFDSLSYDDVFLDLDPETTDPHGMPVIRVTHKVHGNEQRGIEFLRQVQRTWLTEAGASETWESPLLIEARHCYGGTRMGVDPQTSVVDAYGLSHEVPNLGVVGASTFPTAGGANPTLTVQATAWRTAQRIVDRFDEMSVGQ